MPRISLAIEAPAEVFVGEPFVVAVVVAAEQAQELGAIEARFLVAQGWSAEDRWRKAHRIEQPAYDTVLRGPAPLAAGAAERLTWAITLPAFTPPSHTLAPAFAQCRVLVRVRMRWWQRDHDRVHHFRVRLPPPPGVTRGEALAASAPPRPAAGEPRLEVTLPASRFVVGESVVGACTLHDARDDSEREIEVRVEPEVGLYGVQVERGLSVPVHVVVPAGGDGRAMPFAVPVERWMPPTFRCDTHRVAWVVTARHAPRTGRPLDVELPIEILDARANLAALPALPVPASPESERFDAFAAATAGWRVLDSDELDTTLSRERAGAARELLDATLVLAYAYRGADGGVLVATLRPAPLGLGLSVTPSSLLRSVILGDVKIGHAPWDRAYYVVARHAAQTAPFLRALVPHTLDRAALGPLVAWTDHELRFERPIGALTAEALAEAAAELEVLHRAVETAAQAIAPPAGIAVDRAAWVDLARALRGTLAPGDLGIVGMLDDLPVEIDLVWAEPLRASAVRVRVGDPERTAARLEELAVEWPPLVVEPRLADGVLEAQLPLGSPPALSATRVRELAEFLRLALASLDPRRGPYR